VYKKNEKKATRKIYFELKRIFNKRNTNKGVRITKIPRAGSVHVEYANIAGDVENANATNILKASSFIISLAIM
jgi:hypothetical protein